MQNSRSLKEAFDELGKRSYLAKKVLSQLHRDFGSKACPAARFYEEKSGEARPQKSIKILKAKKRLSQKIESTEI